MDKIINILIDKVLSKITWLELKTYHHVLSQAAHFMIHAMVSFFLMSLPFNWAWCLFLPSLVYAFFKEIIEDKYGWKAFTQIDGRTDLIFRATGALAPLLTLLWSN